MINVSNRTKIAIRSQTINVTGIEIKALSGRTFHREKHDNAAASSNPYISEIMRRRRSRRAFGDHRNGRTSSLSAGLDTDISTGGDYSSAGSKTFGAGQAAGEGVGKASGTAVEAVGTAAETGVRAGSAATTAGASEVFHAIKTGFKTAKRTFDTAKKGMENATAAQGEGSKGGAASSGSGATGEATSPISERSKKSVSIYMSIAAPIVAALVLPMMLTALASFMAIVVVIAPVMAAAGGILGSRPDIPPVSTESFAKITEEMLKYEGLDYVWGGESPEIGFDCSGLVHLVYLDAFGIDLPRQSQGMYDYCVYVEEPEAAQGDLVFLRGTSDRTGNDITHVAIYCGGNVIYEAGDNGVGYSTMDSAFFREHFAGFGRVPGKELIEMEEQENERQHASASD